LILVPIKANRDQSPLAFVSTALERVVPIKHGSKRHQPNSLRYELVAATTRRSATEHGLASATTRTRSSNVAAAAAGGDAEASVEKRSGNPAEKRRKRTKVEEAGDPTLAAVRSRPCLRRPQNLPQATYRGWRMGTCKQRWQERKERIGDSWKDNRLSSPPPPPRPRVWLQEGRADAAAAVCRGTTASGQITERLQRRCQCQVTSCAGSYGRNPTPSEWR